MSIIIGIYSAACCLATKKRYEALRSSRIKIGKFLAFRPYSTYTSLLRRNDLETAFRFQAEICNAQGGLFSSKKWRERVLLAGAISAYLGEIDRASNWLAAGVQLQKTSLIARAKTYGFPEEFVSWIIDHQRDIETVSGWRSIFAKNTTSERREALLLYIFCLVMAMGLTAYISPLLSRSEMTMNRALWQAILIRADKELGKSEQIFDTVTTFDGSTEEVTQRIASNIVNRVFAQDEDDVEPISGAEMAWLATHDNSLPFEEPGFYLATDAVRLIVRGEFAECLRVLSEAVNEKQGSLDLLDDRIGPKKIFIGGFGWSGSGAVYDALRGYPSVDEMPGPKHAPYVNDGADSEPMLYQGPASIMALSKEFLKRGFIQNKTWQKFFVLYILNHFHRDYFEYKTVWASRNIINKLGSDNYYSIINRMLFDYASDQLLNPRSIIKKEVVDAKNKVRSDMFVQFGQRIVNSLFPDDTSIVLFNNAINTHKLEALKFTGGRCSYIAVDRSMPDQMADQRKHNAFFRFGVMRFAFYKFEKLYKFSQYKKSVSSMNEVDFIEISFEDWVGKKENRQEITERLIGYYNEAAERRYFHSEASANNIGISKHILSTFELRVLSLLQYIVR